MANKETIELGVEFKSLNYSVLEKQLEEITKKAYDFINSFKTNPGKDLKVNFVEASQALEKLNVERKNALENEKRLSKDIKAFETARILAEKQGNKTAAEKFKIASQMAQAEKKANAESLKAEREMTAEIEKQKDAIDKKYDAQKKQDEFKTKVRDDFRKKGVMAGLKDLSPISALNREFDSKIGANDSIISKSTARMQEIDKELLEPGLTEEEKAEKEKERAELQTKINKAKEDNRKLTAGQTAMNTAINSVKKLGNIATGVFKVMGIDLKSIMSDVFNNIKQMLGTTGIASYATGSTLFTNSTAREQQMKYGLSNSSNYALSQTMEMLNMKSDEDLMYMNQNQKEMFNNLMDKYRGWYENLESTGAMVKLQEAQLEFKMFKQELSMKLLNWFANHKEAIFSILEITMNVLEFIANVVEGILNFFGKSVKSSSSALGSSDTYSSNTNSNININVNNTNNATANLNSKVELDNSLNASNQNLVKSIATTLTNR